MTKLRAASPSWGPRTWAFVAYDQLNSDLGLLASLPPEEVGIVLVESTWKASQRLVHKQKLGLILTAQRHFALEQAERGVAVRYIFTGRPYDEVLRGVADELGPLHCVVAAERELRQLLMPLVNEGLLVEHQHGGWLTTRKDFAAAMRGKKRWRMDGFYRYIRRRYDILMDDTGHPIGGKLSHDADNRLPWRGEPPAPEPPVFPVDDITAEVVTLIEERFSHHPGQLRPERLAARLDDVERLWKWTQAHCLTLFGPYEDAMSTRSTQLFHGRLSGLINLHRLLPRRLLDDVLSLNLPINSKEGFVRQLLGWREFVRHVHAETDGLRVLPASMPSGTHAMVRSEPALNAAEPLPPVYWSGDSGLNCLDHVVQEVWREGYSHHINRLMVLANWGTLLGIDPEALSDWFWVAFEDAFDWVVEPNVLGMGTYALGDLMVTKPYISGSAYISKMSDYCDTCQFHPKKTCPMTHLYWSFLQRNEAVLSGNPRMSIVMAALRKRSPSCDVVMSRSRSACVRRSKRDPA